MQTDNQQGCPLDEPAYNPVNLGLESWDNKTHFSTPVYKTYTLSDLIAFGEEVKKKCAEMVNDSIESDLILSIDVTKLIP